MCKNIKYWMKFYMTCVIKGGLIAVVASFLLFECSDDSSKIDNPNNPNNPDKSVIGKVIISKNMLAFDDTSGLTGGGYTISLSQDLAANKTVQIILTSVNDILQISPAVVNFTETTGKAPQTVTITRKAGASDMIPADITRMINHTIASDTDSDPNITTFQDGNIVNVIVRSTAPIGNVIISEHTLAFDDTAGETGVEYTISLSQDPILNKTVQIAFTIDNDALQISPDVVNFTGTTGKVPQTVTITRKAGVFDMIFEDITGIIHHTITPGANSDPTITIFQDGNSTVDVTVNNTTPADPDRDGLIEIYTAEMLNNMRHNLAGTSYKTEANVLAGEPGDSSGCPSDVCNGYELAVDIDLLSLLDANKNGDIDTTMIGIDTNADGDTTDTNDKQVEVIDTNKDTSWMPIGDNSTSTDASRFTGTFEGNSHTITNLWVNITSSTNNVYAGLFGVTGGTTVTIRNVEIISGSIHSSATSSAARNSISYSGGLVGNVVLGHLTIIKSYFSGFGQVSSSSSLLPASTSNSNSNSYSGGLVGSSPTVTIINSYFSGSGVFSSSINSSHSAESYSGGLVGQSIRGGKIINSYFSGSGGIFSSSSSSSSDSSSYSGGLVGSFRNSLSIMNSYFSNSGKISSSSSSSSSDSSSYSGGLVARYDVYNVPNEETPETPGTIGTSLLITDSYFGGSAEISSSAATTATFPTVYVGGLVGFFFDHSKASPTITNGYWNTDTPQSVNGVERMLLSDKRAEGGIVDNGDDGLTFTGLMTSSGAAISAYPSGLPHDTTPNDMTNDNTKAWHLGTNMQLPAVKLCVPTVDTSTTPPTTDWTMCASYGALLAGQRMPVQ